MTDAEITQAVHESAMWHLEDIRHSLDENVTSEYYLHNGDSLFRVKKVTKSPEGTVIQFYPFEALLNGGDSDSSFVIQYHDYYDEPEWIWEDADTVTAVFKCFLGDDIEYNRNSDLTHDKVEIKVAADEIVKKVIKEPTKLTDGEVECTASVKFTGTSTFLEETYTNTKTFVLEATDNPSRVEFTTQPKDVTVAYPEGATFHVEVADPDLVASYQWVIKDPAKTIALDGKSSKTDTLVIPSTQIADVYQEYQCITTDKNGNKAYSDFARLTVTNTYEA